MFTVIECFSVLTKILLFFVFLVVIGPLSERSMPDARGAYSLTPKCASL